MDGHTRTFVVTLQIVLRLGDRSTGRYERIFKIVSANKLNRPGNIRMVFNFCMRNAEVLNRDGIDAV